MWSYSRRTPVLIWFLLVCVSCTPNDILARDGWTIGLLSPLTGYPGITIVGSEFKRGADLAREMLTEGDVLDDGSIIVIPEDTQFRPQVAIASTKKLLTADNVDLIIALLDAEQSAAISPVVARAGTAVIAFGEFSPHASRRSESPNSRTMFHIGYNLDRARYLVDEANEIADLRLDPTPSCAFTFGSEMSPDTMGAFCPSLTIPEASFRRLQQAIDGVPTPSLILGHMAMQIALSAIEEAKSAGHTILETISMSSLQTTFGPVSFRESHDISLPFFLVMRDPTRVLYADIATNELTERMTVITDVAKDDCDGGCKAIGLSPLACPQGNLSAVPLKKKCCDEAAHTETKACPQGFLLFLEAD